MDDCIFCKIIRKEIPAVIVRETDEFITFVDTKPNNFGHCLIVPKEHFQDIYSLGNPASAKLGGELRIVSKAVKEAVLADGINVHMNNEPAAGQIIFHAHFHIIPRFKNDGFHPWTQKGYKYPEQIDEIGEKIRKAIAS